MTNKKMGKNEKKYECIICDFKTLYNSNYDKHLMTAKHKRLINTNKKPLKNGAVYDCECGKTYKHQSSLCKHKQNCRSINNNTFIDIQENSEEKPSLMDIISQNKEIMDALILQNGLLMKQNQEMQKTIQEIVPNIGNNNNNNTINNHFKIQNFLNEDCKDAINFSEFIENIKISFEDLEHQAEVGYINGVSRLFIENLQELGTHKRPIHCTDKKRKTLYIKENDTWDKEGSQNTLKKGIQEVSRKNLECLIEEKEKNSEEYNDIESEFSEKCLHIQRNILPGVPRETSISKVIEKISQKSGIL